MSHQRLNKSSANDPTAQTDAPEDRRSFVLTVAMYTGLMSAYGFFAALAGRFLFPARPAPKAWLFVGELSRFSVGSSLPYQAPDGRRISVARLGDAGTADDFIALSSVCPHLGCQVHWEAVNTRFFCPCHNGTFDQNGIGTGGPPGEARQSLSRYPLTVENGLLFIQVTSSGDVLA